MTFWGLIVFLVIGFLAGLIARAVVPGRQSLSLLATTLLGVVGAFVGGIIGSLLTGDGAFSMRPSGFIGATLGAIVVLLLMSAAGKRRLHA